MSDYNNEKYAHERRGLIIIIHLMVVWAGLLIKGVDTRGALGASAPPDFEALIHPHNII